MSKSVKACYPNCFSVLTFSFLFCVLVSCNKDSGTGASVLPVGDILSAYTTDTTTVLSSVEYNDSVLSNAVAQMQLGSYYNPVFGPTKASIYTQVVFPGSAASYSFGGGGYILDSVVLALPFYNAGAPLYGTLSPQTFKVYVLDSNLYLSKAYYSNDSVHYINTPIADETITPNPYDSAKIKYGINYIATYPPELRIKLDTNWGLSVMNAAASYFQSTSSFFTLFKGLYITVSNPVQLPGQGGILRLDPYEAGAGLIFYYRVGTDTVTPQVFLLGSGCAYFCRYQHDYSTTPFYVAGKDSVLSPDVAYVQAMAGVKMQLSFPFLSNWKKIGPVVINAAEVQIPVNTAATGTNIPPVQAYLVRDSAGYSFSLSDQALNSYGGAYDATNRRYDFNIARYVQAVVDGKITDRGLYFIPGSNAVTANGAVLYGTAKNTNMPRTRIKIYYTPLK